MPVRFTDSVCPQKKLFKNTPGTLRGVMLDSSQEETVRASTDSEIVLSKMPLSLQVEVALEDGVTFVHELPPEYVIWSRDALGNAKVKRRGFRISRFCWNCPCLLRGNVRAL